MYVLEILIGPLFTSFGLIIAFTFGLLAALLLAFDTFFFYFAGFRHFIKLNSREYIQQNRGVKQAELL